MGVSFFNSIKTPSLKFKSYKIKIFFLFHLNLNYLLSMIIVLKIILCVCKPWSNFLRIKHGRNIHQITEYFRHFWVKISHRQQRKQISGIIFRIQLIIITHFIFKNIIQNHSKNTLIGTNQTHPYLLQSYGHHAHNYIIVIQLYLKSHLKFCLLILRNWT